MPFFLTTNLRLIYKRNFIFEWKTRDRIATTSLLEEGGKGGRGATRTAVGRVCDGRFFIPGLLATQHIL